jgi:hypothetical protein
MPQYTVNLPASSGGGQIVVNASDPQSAIENAGSPSGAYVTAGSYTGGAGQPTGPTSTTATSTSSGDQGFNSQAATLAAQVANNAAQMAYYNAKLQLDSDELAFKKAQQAWQNTFDTESRRITTELQAAGLTGQYQGAPTLAAQKQAFDQAATEAGLTGYYQAPAAAGGSIALDAFSKAGAGDQQTYLNATGGDRNAAAQRYWTDVQGAIQQAGMTPQQFVYGATAQPTPGVETLASRLQTANLLGTYQGQQTLEAQKQQQQTALQYLTLLSNLRGPADYGQYLRTLGSTPGGLRDLVSAAAGQYVPGGGATTGAQPQAASLGSTLGQVGGQGTTYQDFQQAGAALPPPNQIAPSFYNTATTTQKQLLGSMYEGQGYNVQDVADLYKQSLPRYAGPTTGTYKL